MINTSVADTAYISNVINAYVNKDTKATDHLYEEPNLSKHQTELNRLLKHFGQTQNSWKNRTRKDENEKLIKERQIKRDNTRITEPKPFKNN